MTKKLFATAALAVLAFAAQPAFANTVEHKGPETKTEYKDNGGYTTTTTEAKKNADGTTIKGEAKVDVDVDDDGDVTKKVKNEKITDPKGILNEKAKTSETTIEQKDRGYVRETRSSNSNAAGTSTLTKEQRDVKVDAQGNVIETTKTDKVVDPKGLLNRESTTVEEKRVNGQTIESTVR